MPFGGKPILGIVGGIASGKSFVSKILQSLGCVVIDSDAIAHDVYRQPQVIQTLRAWYGPSIVNDMGVVDRRAIGTRVFSEAGERARLEALLHPLINTRREEVMTEHAADPAVRAFVWDSPLLIEAGLHTQCDALIFVDTPRELRLERTRQSRGWDAGELDRRERSQIALDVKRRLASDIVPGDTEQAILRERLERILERTASRR